MNKPSSVLLVPVLCSVLACNAAPDESQDESMDPPRAPETTVVGQSLTFGGHEYLFVTTPKSWYDARNLCMNQGYHLVSTDTPEEEAFLNEQETRIGLQYWWIGLNDIAREGSWVWAGPNSTTPYFNWSQGQPDNHLDGEDCVHDGWSNGQWNDINCDYAYPFICEKSPASQSQRTFSYSLSNTASATVNTYDATEYLPAGRILTVATCGVEGASGNGDTYLRLINAAGQEIASNDDAGGACKSLSNFSIVIPVAGKYTIRAGCYSSSSCSGTVVVTY